MKHDIDKLCRRLAIEARGLRDELHSMADGEAPALHHVALVLRDAIANVRHARNAVERTKLTIGMTNQTCPPN